MSVLLGSRQVRVIDCHCHLGPRAWQTATAPACMFDVEGVLAELGRYRPGVELVWAQEEPANMGAWEFIDRQLAPRLPGRLAYVGRQPSASPAVGSATRHKLEQEQIVREALGEPVSRLASNRAVTQER